MNTSVIDIDKDEDEDLGKDEEVAIQDLEAELREAVDDGSAFVSRCGDSYDTRWCLWAGQTSDGRKRRDALGKEPFPWEGAADTRIRLADEVINDNVIMMVNALLRSKAQGVPVESQDARAAAAMTTFVKRLMSTEMSESMRIEAPLLGNYQECFGHGIMAVTWDQEVRLDRTELYLADMQAIAQQGAQAGDQESVTALKMMEAMWDDTQEEAVAGWLMSIYQAMRPGQARAAVRKLRSDGVCEVPQPQVTRNQPCWTALRPFRDVFYPANTTSLAGARWIAWREVLSPGDLRARILTEGYDEEAVKQACDNRVGDERARGCAI